MEQLNPTWWQEEYGFFGDFYMEGDNSEEGYLSGRVQTLSQRTEVEANGVIKLLGVSPGAKILDVPCGYGRHSISLAKKGFNVTGCDINTRHLGVAQESASKQGVTVDFRKKNMINVDFVGQFDGVINMFYSFGIFDLDQENFKVLQNFHTALKPGGKFLMHTDVNMPRIYNGKYKHDEVRTAKSGNKLRIIDNYNETTKRIDGAWILIDQDNKEIRKDYSVRVYEKDEFIAMCIEAGFKKCDAYSDWDGSAYNPESEDMIVIATK